MKSPCEEAWAGEGGAGPMSCDVITVMYSSGRPAGLFEIKGCAGGGALRSVPERPAVSRAGAESRVDFPFAECLEFRLRHKRGRCLGQ
ncbi:protein of unknown function [Paraburkholderia kururiensis]